jgi:hypothetical protein
MLFPGMESIYADVQMKEKAMVRTRPVKTLARPLVYWR